MTIASNQTALASDVLKSLSSLGYVKNGARSSRAASPAVGEIYIASDTHELNFCTTAGTWSTVGIGSSFPGSPATNDLFFRTDLGWLCYYDGTRWLTVHQHSISIPQVTLSATTTTLFGQTPMRTDYAPYFSRVCVNCYVVTTNDGSNYWSFAFLGSNAAQGAFTTIATVTTSAGAASAYQTTETGTMSTANPSNKHLLVVQASKTGSPGSLNVASATAYYRLIVT